MRRLRRAGYSEAASNGQSQSLLKAMQSAHLKHVVAAHLSERTNHPDIVAECLTQAAASANAFEWSIAAQEKVLPWFDV